LIATAGTEASDCELVDAVRAGDDVAFEALYRRYQPRIAGFVRGMLHDETRAEDVAQEAFLSALRRMRATDAEINFKPWIYQIARNAAIDSYRRNSHAVEVSMDSENGLRASDRHRLVGIDGGPDAALVTKERLNHLQSAFDELSDVHTKVLVMRELEGMSYREIGDQLDLTRPAVESALFRARRRLESEYAEIADGRRCVAMRATLLRMVQGTQRETEEHRLARHLKRCHSCRHRARVLGVEPQTALGTLRKKVAALLPIPWLFKRSGGDGGGISGLFSTGANAAPLAERAAALVAAAALVGAGGAALGSGALRGDRATAGEDRHAIEHSAPVSRESQRGTAGNAADGERAGARRASRRRGSGPAGGRAGGSGGSSETLSGGSGPQDSAGGSGGSGTQLPGGSGTQLPTDSLPSLPNATSPTGGGTGGIDLQAPELPTITPREGTTIPEVQVPETGVPPVDGVTGEVEDVTNGLTGTLP
jgi:RNA polymerase sigma factor (sigma-70 family)